MSEDTLFSKIIRKEIPSDMVYQDELVTAFRDITPKAPTHILLFRTKLFQRLMTSPLKMKLRLVVYS